VGDRHWLRGGVEAGADGGAGTGPAVQVDLEGVTDLDVTAVQLLWAARREAQDAGARFAMSGQLPGRSMKFLPMRESILLCSPVRKRVDGL